MILDADFARPGTVAPTAGQSDAQVRQRRRLCRRADGARLQPDVSGSRRSPERQRGAIPDRDAADDLPRLFRLGDRRHAGRPTGRPPLVGRHLAGAGCRSPRPHGGGQVGSEDGSHQDGRHAAEHEVHARAAGGRERHRTSWRIWSRAISAWKAITCNSMWSGRNVAQGPGGAGAASRSDRASCRLQRLLLRSVARAAGRNRGTHRARRFLVEVQAFFIQLSLRLSDRTLRSR